MYFAYNNIILQPTTFCNLDCDYCYLYDRDKNQKMLFTVIEHLALHLSHSKKKISLIWHGGEPLSCGIDYFSKLIKPLSDTLVRGKIRQSIQTNCTLVTDEWCDLFKTHNIRIGISIDGPESFNVQRKDWKQRPIYNKILKGIEILKRNNVPFSVIAVINQKHYNQGEEIYNYFVQLGCTSIGFNTQEQEGQNEGDGLDTNEINNFWKSIFEAWQKNPVIRVREISNALSWMNHVCSNQIEKNFSNVIDFIPTIAWNGDVVVLSPELNGAKSEKHNNFVVGNVLQHSLKEILSNAQQASYVQEFVEGYNLCQDTCEYFSYCGGGQASNKFFENGSLATAETSYCRNTKKRVINSILESI